MSISWKTGCMTLFISYIIKVLDSVFFFSLVSRSSLWHSEVLYTNKEPQSGGTSNFSDITRIFYVSMPSSRVPSLGN